MSDSEHTKLAQIGHSNGLTAGHSNLVHNSFDPFVDFCPSIPGLSVVGDRSEGLADPLLQRVELLLRLHGERHGGRGVVASLQPQNWKIIYFDLKSKYQRSRSQIFIFSENISDLPILCLELDESAVGLRVRHLAVGRERGGAAPHELAHRVAGPRQGTEDLEGGVSIQ